MDRCALFVDAGYLLADGAMAAVGTRRRDSVSWDHQGLLKLLTNLAEEQTGLPLLRCYWYEATVEGRRTPEHDSLADLGSIKLRLSRMRPGRREGVDTEIHRDLTTLARNGAISDAVVVSAEEDLSRVIADVQDLGLRVALLHVTVDGNWTISRSLRQECDGIIEVGGLHLQPFVELIAGAEPVPYQDAGALGNGHSPAIGQAPHPALTAGQHPGPPAIYTSPALAQYHPADQSRQLPAPVSRQAAAQMAQPPATPEMAQPPSAPDMAQPQPGPQMTQPPAAGGQGPPAGVADTGQADDGHSQDAQQAPGAGRRAPRGRHSQRRDRTQPAAQAGQNHSGQPVPPDLRGGGAGQGREPQAYPAAGAPVLPAPTAPPGPQAPAGPQPPAAPGALPEEQRPGWGPGYPGSPGAASGGTYVPAQHAPYGGPQQPPHEGSPAASSGLTDAVQAAHAEGHDFGESVARDAPALWLEAVLARKPRMPSDLEARLLQGSSLPIDYLLHDEVRHALRRGFWDALEGARR